MTLKAVLISGWIAALAAVPAARFLSSEPSPILALPDGFIGVFLDVTDGGLTVTGVVPGSPAQQAGLGGGDRILALNGQAVATQPQLASLLEGLAVGDEIELTVARDVTALLGASPNGDERGWLGVNLDEEGLTITSTEKGSAAREAGLAGGDRVLAIGGEPVASYEVLAERVGGAGAGTEIELSVRRDLSLRLGAKPSASSPAEPTPPTPPAEPAAPGFLGVELTTDGGGARVLEVVPDSPAAHAGLKSGDVILRIGSAPIASLEDVAQAVLAAGAGATVEIDFMSHSEGDESFRQAHATLARHPSGSARERRERVERSAAETNEIEVRMRMIELEMKQLSAEYERSMLQLRKELEKLGSRLGDAHSSVHDAAPTYGWRERLEDSALVARVGARQLARQAHVRATNLARQAKRSTIIASQRATEIAQVAKVRATELAEQARAVAAEGAQLAHEQVTELAALARDTATEACDVAVETSVEAGEAVVEVADDARQEIADKLNGDVREQLGDLRAELEALRRQLKNN